MFGDDRPVEFEVGSGKGLFLANAATAHPDHNFLGVELAKKYARRAAERVAKLELTNVRVYPGDAKAFLAQPRRAVEPRGDSRLLSGPVVEGAA